MFPLARVRNSRILFQSNVCNLFCLDFAAFRIIGVYVIAKCPQGESSLYVLRVKSSRKLSLFLS